MITHIDHIVLTVRDIEASVAFYERVLQIQPVTFAGGRRALHFGTQKINLQTPGQETRNFAGIGSGDLCLITEMTTDDLLAHLAAEEVPIVEGPVTKSGAQGPITSVYFNDPDGNLIEVSRYDRSSSVHKYPGGV
ncbi:MAG: VOC family protein [Paracoccaceae bacterium]